MSSPWLAVGAGTSAVAQAHDLRLARQRFLSESNAVAAVRSPILGSWRRSAAAGVDPEAWGAPLEVDEQEAAGRFADHPLGRLRPVTQASLAAVAEEAEYLIVISDADGTLLSVEGARRVREQAAEEMRFAAGAVWRESAVGTNAIGTALAANHPVQVFASEHFNEHMQWWTCAAAPVHDPASGEILGAVNVTARMETVHPASLGMVVATAATLEAELRTEALLHGAGGGQAAWRAKPAPESGLDRDAEIAFEVLGQDRAKLRLDGRPITLSQRHSEILVLLSAHTSGLTGEQLALALYGDEGKPVTARAEMSRLKRLLGSRLQAEPYRLEAVVESDLATMQSLLRDGQVARAAERYRGPLMPRSEAPGVAALRDELDGWTRRSVMASDQPEVLWAWLSSPSGEDDMHGWKRFLSGVSPEDGRRGLAAARLERLRALYRVGGDTASSPAVVSS